MRYVLIAAIASLQIVTASLPVLACPAGYGRCGTHYCCPR
jgi:hypothetical protein